MFDDGFFILFFHLGEVVCWMRGLGSRVDGLSDVRKGNEKKGVWRLTRDLFRFNVVLSDDSRLLTAFKEDSGTHSSNRLSVFG